MKFKFKLIDSTYTLIKCKRAKGDVVIPAEFKGKPVTAIGDSAFYGCTGLTSVTIPDSVTSIDWNAFCNCTGLTSVTIPDSVTSIGGRAFYNCTGLTEINFNATAMNDLSSDNYVFAYAGQSGSGIAVNVGANVTRIPAYLFYSHRFDSTYTVKLAHVKFAQNSKCTGIGSYAFSDCTGLTSVTIPGSVTSIGSYAFSGCTGLTSVTIPDSVTSIGERAFYWCTGLKSVTIPDSVTSIGYDAFYNCTGLTSVTIGNSVTGIGAGAFCNCTGLTSVTIPDSVTSIGYEVFYSCTGLTSVIFEDVEGWKTKEIQIKAADLTTPDAAARCLTQTYTDNEWSRTATPQSDFHFDFTLINGTYTLTKYTGNCKTLHIPSAYRGVTVTAIADSAFKGCTDIRIIHIPSNITAIGNSAFEGCTGLVSVKMADGVTAIGEFAFGNCQKLSSITLSEGLTSIPAGLFRGCTALTAIRIPRSVTSIGKSAFASCGLADIRIPSSVTAIGETAFGFCSKLTDITVPYSVTTIGKSAFAIGNLATITVEAGNPVYHSAGNCLIETKTATVVAGCKNSKIPTDGSVTAIGDSAFWNCGALTSIAIPAAVTTIGKDAFQNCGNLRHVLIEEPEGWSIDTGTVLSSAEVASAYHAARLLKNTLFDSGTWRRDLRLSPEQSMEFAMVDGTYTLTRYTGLFNRVRIPARHAGVAVTAIGKAAFQNCGRLGAVIIPTSISFIDEKAFEGCTALKAAYFEGTNGWRVLNVFNDITGTAVNAEDLSAPATAAEHLTKTHCSRLWQRATVGNKEPSATDFVGNKETTADPVGNTTTC